jgi:plasmid segregation protein ParM
MISRAIDDGYGDLKYSSNEMHNLIPSFVTPFKPKPDKSMSNKDESLLYIASKIDGQKYVVGDYAAKLDTKIKWIGGEDKHADSRFPILFKTGLGMLSNRPYERIDTLVMNLPIKSDTEFRRNQLMGIAKGNHELELSFDGVEFFKREIEVNDVVVKKQPFGSLAYLILDRNGKIENTNLANGFNVIVDIGARTVNILTVDQLEEQPGLTIHSNDGMFSAFEEVGKYLESELNTMIPDGKLPQIIQKGEIRGMDIKPLIKVAYQNHANIIASMVDTLLVDSWGFVTSIIFTGGGSQLLKPYLEDHYEGAPNIKFLNRFSTVIGLERYGKFYAAKNSKQNNISVRVGNGNG